MTIRTLLPAALAASALLTGAVAPAAAAPPANPDAAGQANAKDAGRQCFRPDDVNGFTVVDDRTVNVRVGVGKIYQLTLFSSSPDIDWTQHIGIEARGTSWVCSGLDATLIVPSPIGAQRYPVTAIHRLTPEEIAALKRKHRP